MKKLRMRSILAMTMTMALGLSCLTGCGQQTVTDADNAAATGGVLCLKVNPEIAISYNADGIVTQVAARNDDGMQILKDYPGFEGKECRTVVSELVKAIGDAGSFVEEVDGSKRQIVLEIEEGSVMPTATFMDDVVADVRSCVSANAWQSPLDVMGESDYDITDYVDTDYGPENDGDTDYADTDYGKYNDGVTDYDDTDYGPSNDGVTDYADTDYGPNGYGVTDYGNTN